MDSGIYVLRFPNGYFYVGKSDNIPNRWKQHWKDFEKGTHSRRMQEAFNTFGYPDREVLITCHSDHCDLYESMVIRYNMGPKCLNGNQPREVPPDEVTILRNSAEYIKLSTAQHIKLITDGIESTKEAVAKQNELRLRVEDLEDRGILTPEDIQNKLEELESEVLQYSNELERLKGLSWFQRIFNFK